MGHDGTQQDELTRENERHHAWQEDRLLDFVEQLTLLDWDAAERALDRFVAQLTAHMALEEQRSLPALKRLLSEDPPAGLDVDKLIKQIDGDHVILTRTLERVRAALAEARAANRRRHLARELDTFLLLRRVLEHHTSRESRDLYPRLDAGLSDEQRVVILQALHALYEEHA